MNLFAKFKLKELILLGFMWWSIGSIAQSGFAIPLDIGFGFNQELVLHEEVVHKSAALMLETGVLYEFKIRKKLLGVTGLTGRFIYAFGKTENVSFRGRTLRARLPIMLGYRISEKWKIYTGVVLQNNNDFTKIDLREKYFWRTNLVASGKYQFAKKWYATTAINIELRDIPKSYYLTDTQFYSTVGIGRNF